MSWLRKKTVRVETTSLPLGHAILVQKDGVVLDLGPCSVEDVELIAAVASEAYVRFSAMKRKPGRVTTKNLGRVREVTRVFQLALKDQPSQKE